MSDATAVYDGMDYSGDYWPPDFIGIKSGRLEIRRKHATCSTCRNGDHSRHMKDDRCLRIVDPVPYDFVCLCREEP